MCFPLLKVFAKRAISYAQKFLGDSCVAMNLLEEAATAVSEAIRAKEATRIAPIRDVPSYLSRVFLRKVAGTRLARRSRGRASGRNLF
jgi:hypothetical protein